MWSNLKYPNIELLEYKAMAALRKDDTFNKTFREKIKDKKYIHPELDAIVFPQIWGSTCTGFDVTSDGSAVIAGCAMTKEYTTVFHELTTDMYVVFFGENPCYMVNNPNTQFYDDLKKHQLCSLSQAKNLY